MLKQYVLSCLIVLMLAGCAAPPPQPLVAAPRDTKAPRMPRDESAEETTLPVAPAPPTAAPRVEKPAGPADDVLDYLEEVAISGFEFGDAPKVVYKWTRDLTVSVSGTLTAGDRSALNAVVADLNELIAPREVTLVESGGDITIFYGPDSEFRRRLSSYTPGNRGYFAVNYGANYSLRSATILISTQVDSAARAHLVREELTQSLGLFQDSMRYSQSIFYQGWTTTNRYSELDRAIIRLLYDARIKPGMTARQVRALLAD